MSQRRPVSSTTAPKVKVPPIEDSPAVTSSSADSRDPNSDPIAPLSIEEQYQRERHALRKKLWLESPFAVGLTEPTWIDERSRPFKGPSNYGDDELESDASGCLYCSAQVCPILGASRVGNMAVLSQTETWKEVEIIDEETGENTTQKKAVPKLNLVVGPYWPMLVFATYPLILGISVWTFMYGILKGKPKPFVLVWMWVFCTLSLISALALTACRDPGIMYRYPTSRGTTWRWSDQAQTYRPRGAFYDFDTAVVVEGFDHTCPWTGTAIGKKNLLAFQIFVCMVFVCMVLDIFILTGVFG